MTVLGNIFLARVLGTAAFGAFTLIATIMFLASTVATLGMGGVIVRTIAESLALADSGRARLCLRRSCIIGVTATIFVAVVSPFAIDLFPRNIPSGHFLMVTLAATVALLAWQQLAADCLRGLHETRWAGLLSGGKTGGPFHMLLLMVFVFIADLFHCASLECVVLLTACASAVTGLLAWIAVQRFAGARLDGPLEATRVSPANALVPPSSRYLLSIGIRLMLVQVVSFGALQADVWIAGFFCDAQRVAEYAAATRIVLLIVLPLQIVEFTVAATVAQLHVQGNRKELERILRTAASWAAIPALLAVALIWFCGEPLVTFVFGSSYAGSAPLAAILSGGQVIAVVTGACITPLLMTGNQNALLVVNLVTLIMTLVVGTVAADYYGVEGLAICTSLIISGQNIAQWLLVRIRIGVWPHAGLRHLRLGPDMASPMDVE